MSYVISPIIKVTEVCNFDCSFCRYSNHKQKNEMISVDLVKKILRETAEINAKTSRMVKVLFHGGEPLLWGIDNFRKIYQYEKEIANWYGVRFLNSIQTNAFLINDEWMNLFLEDRTSIGISLDGPVGTNAHFSGDEKQSFDKTILTLIKLKAKGIPFGILSVITNKHIEEGAKSFYDFLIANDIKNSGLCYCYNPDDDCSVNPERLGYYLSDLFDLYFYGKERINIREFNDAILTIIRGRHNCCSHHYRKRCGYYLTFLPSGNAFFCDPYNLRKENCLGNISNYNVLEMVSCEKHKELSDVITKQINNYCKNCFVKDICGYSCPRTDVDDKENYFCTTYKIIYAHIAEVVKKNKKFLLFYV